MAPVSIPSTEPTRAIAGDTWRWDKAVDGYTPAGGWGLSYSIRGKGKCDVTGVANAAQTGWEITVAASATAALPAGTYEWALAVTKAGERYTVESGSFVVAANLALAAAGDRESHAERTLAVIEARIEGRLTTDMERYVIEGREVERIPMRDLIALRRQYRAEVARGRNGGRLPAVRMRFASA